MATLHITSNQPSLSSGILVIVDPAVSDYQTLLSDCSPQAEVHILDKDRDGITQITEILEERKEKREERRENFHSSPLSSFLFPLSSFLHPTPLHSLHIISHGAPGIIYLGNSTLELSNLEPYRSQLQKWNISHLYIYGCKVAAGDAGAEFLTKLYQITQAQIYANPHLTGNAAKGGTWSLQPVFPPYTLHPTPFSPETLATYQGILGDADLDTTFGIGGKVTKDFSGPADSVEAITIDSNGKILVAGYAVNAYTDIALARYNSDGVLDPTFGTGGIVTTAIQFYDKAHAITIDSNGKILVAGQGRSSDFALVRYNSYGVLDNTFGTGGIVTTDITSYAYGDKFHDITIDSNGKILAAGYVDDGSNSNFALIRYNSNGNLDTSFGGGDGIVTTDFGSGDDFGRAMTIDSSGKILVGGYARNGSNDDFGLARYNSNGSLDTSFGGGDGKVTTNFGSGNDQGFAMTIDSSGKILVAGYAWNGSNRDFSLARYNSNGSLDTSFGGGDGKVITDFGSGDDEGRAITIDGNGKILVSGFASNGTDKDFALARYNSDGTLDTTFDTDGKITKAIGSGYDEGYDITIDSSGKILVAGRTQNGINSYGYPNYDFGLVRYGTPDFTSTAPTSATEDVAYTYDIAANLKLAITGTTIPSWLTLTDNGNGTATLTGTPTNSEVGNHSVSLKITDPDGGQDTQDFTIAVSNVNDAPTDINLSSSSIAENSANNTTVGILSTTDPDAGNTHSYTLPDNAGGRFKISGNQIQVANSSLLNYESATSHTIQVRTTDQGGLNYTKNFTIGVTNVNETPTNISLSSSSIAENSANNTTVGILSTTDPDTGNTHTYTLSNNAGGRFKLSGNQIQVANSSLLNYESATSHTIQVRTTDQGGLNYTKNFTIGVTNVNEAPQVNNQSFSIEEHATNGATVGTVVANDVDGNSLTYSITAGNDDGIFSINSSTGKITIADSSQLDFETTANYNLTVQVKDAVLGDSAIVAVNIINVNDAPEITSTVPTSATEDISYTYDIVADDPDVGDSLTISALTALPSWLTLTDNGDGTATLAGTPTNDEVGGHTIELEVADADGAVDTQNFTVTVTNVNDAPEITSTAPTSATQNFTYTYNIVVDDPDVGDSLTITGTTLPSWLTLTDNGDGTATLTGNPTNSDVGDHTVELQVEDAEGEVATQSFTLKVKNTNDTPTITGTPDTTVDEDTNYSFIPTSEDIDGDVLSFSIQNKPDWATFDSTTGELSGTPTNDDVGTISNIVISVSDGTVSVDLPAFDLTVNNVNDAPTITGTPLNTVNEDTPYSFTPTAKDVDNGDTLTFSIQNKPAWATFDSATGKLSGTPTNDHVGTTSNIVISVNDGTETVALDAFDLTVNNVNDAPTITGTPLNTVNEDTPYSFTPTAKDVDNGDTLAFSIQNKPAWATFDSKTGKLSGTPTNDHVGTTSNIVISVNDGKETVALPGFNLTVRNVNDAPTDISPSPNPLSVVENSLEGTVVGELSTTDSDVGDSHTYILESNPDGSFKVSDGIFKISGRNLVVGQGYKLDYEAYGDKEPKQVIIRVLTKDKGGLTYYEDIAIDIEDAVITSDSELDRYLRDRNIISVPSAALKTVFNVFELGERSPDTTPTAQVEYGQNGLDASNDIISLTRVQDASIPLPKFLSALGTISPYANLSPVDSLLKSFGASIDVSEPTFTITDLNSGPIYEVSGKVPLFENQKNFLGFLKDVLGVDELTLKAGFNSVTLKPYVLAPIDISDITLFEAGDFSLELTSADLFMEVDPKSREATVAITPKANLANYDPTQSNEPDLELQGLFTFEKDSMMAGLMLAPSQVWKNPLGIQNTEIRKVSLELGKSYVNPSFDKINLVGDLKSGTIDIASAFAIDATDPKKTAILLTSNNPIGWSDIVSLPVFSYGLAKQGIASKIQPVKDTLQFLANMMDIEIQSIDADKNGILDPLIKLVPESVTIAGTTVQPGFAMNGKFTAWGATAILAVEGNPYNYTNPNFTGSLQIPKIDWGWLKLSGANNSALNFEIAADSRQQSFSGNGSVSILGKTIANTDFTLVSSSNSQSVEIDKFNVSWGILGINANDVLVSFTDPVKDYTGVVKTKQIPKEIAGTGSITILGKKIANTDFEITQTSATIKDFNIDLGILALDADNVSVNLGNQTIAGTGSVTVLGKTIANTDFEITQTSATIKDFNIDLGILALDADNVSINLGNQSASFKAGVEILGQRFSNVDVTLNNSQVTVKNLNVGFGSLLSLNIGNLTVDAGGLSGSGSGAIKLFGQTLANGSLKFNNGNLKVSGTLGIGDILGYSIGLDVGVTVGKDSQKIGISFDFLGSNYTLFSASVDDFARRFTSKSSLISATTDVIWGIIGDVAGYVKDLLEDGIKTIANVGSMVIDAASDLAKEAFDTVTDWVKDLGIFGSGTSDPINYQGNSKNNKKDGDDNSDALFGNGGNDTLHGRLRPDLIDGGSGNDELLGGHGNDTINGGSGNDRIYAQGQDDWAYGWKGDDWITGNGDSSHPDDYSDDDDHLFGGLGNDKIYGKGGDDYLYGDAGDDKLYGGYGYDVLSGGPGKDYLDGGDGYDTADYSYATVGINADLYNDQVDIPGEGQETAKSIENIKGGSGNDTLKGDSHKNKLYGGSGDDWLNGRSGSDYFDGGDGSDTADFSYLTSTGIKADLNAVSHPWFGAYQTVYFTGYSDPEYMTSIENVIGGSGNDTLIGNRDHNYFSGGSGNDSLLGGDGDDVLKGGSGSDYLDGGNGNDTADFSDITSSFKADLSNQTVSLIGEKIKSIENVIGGSGNDTLIGNSGKNYLSGGSGNDSLVGGGGNDVIVAGSGNDAIDGGTGTDVLVLEGRQSDYTFTQTAQGWTITSGSTVKTVKGIEEFQYGKYIPSSSSSSSSAIDYLTNWYSSLLSRVIDGYIAAGEVFFDVNLNGILDEDEPYAFTEIDGSFQSRSRPRPIRPQPKRRHRIHRRKNHRQRWH
jgi:uncharacterized delta-60 repeat protein